MLDKFQQMMNKCTTEQFWAVVAITGMNGFVIAYHEHFVKAMPPGVVVIPIVIATIYGVYFVLHRHISYYDHKQEQAEFFKEDSTVPDLIKTAQIDGRFPRC